MKTNQKSAEEWWANLSRGEKNFLRLLMRLIRSAKHSNEREVARAARIWESKLAFFFRLQLKQKSHHG